MFAITGATGEVGRRVVDQLAAADVPLRLVVRDPSRTAPPPGAEVARATYDDAEAMRRAFDDASTVFLVSAAESAERVRQHTTAVDAAAAAGVERLVYLSFLGAAPDATFTLARQHWATEEHLRASGLAWTFLRDSLYADFWPFFVTVPDLVVRAPAGDGAVAAVARDDVADVAAAVLLSRGAHDGRAYDVTGPEALTVPQACEVMSRALGRTIAYEKETIEEAYASRAGYGAPQFEVDGWVSSYVAIADGSMGTVSRTVEDVAGHPATGLAELLERHPGLLDRLR